MTLLYSSSGATKAPTTKTTGNTSSTSSNPGTSFTDEIANTMLGTELAAYTAQYEWASPVGTQIPGLPTGQIIDAEQSAQMDLAVLMDPARITAWREYVAGQMNAQSGGPTFEDLSTRISDITIETVVQGASTLTVTVIDPQLALLTTLGPSGYPFISSDDIGFLWPPIQVNFPPGTDCVWRLCQVDANSVPGSANLKLTFEDVIVSELRQVCGSNGQVYAGAPDQTLVGFLASLISAANKVLGHDQAKQKPTDYVPIKFVSLVSPQDPNYVAPTAPTSATSVTAPTSRQNALKSTTGLSAQQRQLIDGWESALSKKVAKTTSFTEQERELFPISSTLVLGGS